MVDPERIMAWRCYLATGAASITPGEWFVMSQADQEALTAAGKAFRLENIVAMARALLEEGFLEAASELPETLAQREENKDSFNDLKSLRALLNERRPNVKRDDVPGGGSA